MRISTFAFHLVTGHVHVHVLFMQYSQNACLLHPSKTCNITKYFSTPPPPPYTTCLQLHVLRYDDKHFKISGVFSLREKLLLWYPGENYSSIFSSLKAMLYYGCWEYRRSIERWYDDTMTTMQ